MEPSDLTISAQLDAQGYALIRGLLDPARCTMLRDGWQNASFRSGIHMARHGFGSGRYRYFAYPLPSIIEELREQFYSPLAKIANVWSDRLGTTHRFPNQYSQFIERCRAAGQTRPTPLLLRYEAGDWNALHQDVYGPHVFPLQWRSCFPALAKILQAENSS